MMIDLIKQENQSRQNVIDIYEKAAYEHPEKVDAIKSFFTQARSFGVILSSNHRRLLSEMECLQKVRLLLSMVLLSYDDRELVIDVVGKQGFWGYLSAQKNSQLYNDVMALMNNIQPASSPSHY